MAIPAHPFPEGPKSCGTGVHVHCARCGTADDTVYAAPTAAGGRFPPLCRACAHKVVRLSALRYVTDGAA